LIALDSSAIVAIALAEPESEEFSRLIAAMEALVGTPTLLEARLVLSSKIDDADSFMDEFLRPPEIHPVAFSLEMYQLAVSAFDRFGKGRGHPARLNFGDCLAYAVAKHHRAPLLYKGDDFSRTDLASAVRR
jgi:ribonuclease VapC